MADQKTPSWFTWLRKKLPSRGGKPLIIAAYKSYGTKRDIYLRGRVLEDNTIVKHESRGAFRMIRNTIRRFNTFEKPDMEVICSIADNHFAELTNEEGFFRLLQKINPLQVANENKTNWIPVSCHLKVDPEVMATTQMMIPTAEAEFGVISDIDDTIMHTGVASFLKWQLVYNSALKHVQKRTPLIGAPSFYQALEKGLDGKNTNPFFYISNSPWNLYTYLNRFLENHKFPLGPILLRDFAFPGTKGYRNEKDHKQREIINIFKTYPHLNFVLLGDSAEHDASIYSEVARQFPERVICIYLHTIQKKKQMKYVEGIVNTSKHVEMLLVNKAEDAAIHAKERGLITNAEFLTVRKKEEQPKKQAKGF